MNKIATLITLAVTSQAVQLNASLDKEFHPDNAKHYTETSQLDALLAEIFGEDGEGGSAATWGSLDDSVESTFMDALSTFRSEVHQSQLDNLEGWREFGRQVDGLFADIDSDIKTAHAHEEAPAVENE